MNMNAEEKNQNQIHIILGSARERKILFLVKNIFVFGEPAKSVLIFLSFKIKHEIPAMENENYNPKLT